jgi:hypothetical protein
MHLGGYLVPSTYLPDTSWREPQKVLSYRNLEDLQTKEKQKRKKKDLKQG